MITNYQIQANIQNNERCNVSSEIVNFIHDHKDEVITEVVKQLGKTEDKFGKTDWKKAASIMRRRLKSYKVI